MNTTFLKSGALSILLLISALTMHSKAQTTLSPGDISVIGFNSAISNRDGFAFVPWVTLAPGTTINFTDNGFNSSSLSNSTGKVRALEQTGTWTTAVTVNPGTVIKIEGNGTSNLMQANIGTVSVQNASGTTVNTLLLTQNGDQIVLYQGTYTSGANTAAATLSTGALFAISWQGSGSASSWLTTGSISQVDSYLPSDLTSYSVFLASNAYGGEYSGPRTGLTPAMLKSAVNDASNWTLNSVSGIAAYNTTNFDLGALPVRLLSFTCKASEQGNLLHWTTTDEVNADNFIVERSSNGENFEAIGEVKTGTLDYTFKDNNGKGEKSFYRLKMVDLDASYTYSPVVFVYNKTNLNYSISPNPVASSVLKLTCSGVAEKDAIVQIADMNGRIWHTTTLTSAMHNGGGISLPVEMLTGGVYLLRIYQKGQKVAKTIKFRKE